MTTETRQQAMAAHTRSLAFALASHLDRDAFTALQAIVAEAEASADNVDPTAWIALHRLGQALDAELADHPEHANATD